ncbi:PEGA domain-containing protein [Lujinxingia sediminis]|uniref:PEGA domain-containing protein n=1 Tax=Lujinxingia sediminis TaxID=2480984 RepID=A0ABY0CPS2_9DELT|nr:serine/threonine-protein kinase [Lujinxingia sediminis]RVU42334.1 PEGA domain-containing protein [Lujinxingia sediminis]
MSATLRKLGRYELTRRLAKGGMGEIYLARARGAGGFEKRVIIKTILPHLAEEEEFVTKFLDEGRIVVQLTHGNIVPVFDMGEQDGEYFIAMEYVEGLDLREVLKRLEARGEHLPVEHALHIAAEICKGLGYAHRKTDEQGRPLAIVHRDVSPSNVLISREGEIKIIDFGIARAAGRLSQTANGRIQGKCCYMSPEQTRGQSLDHRSDIFACGVVLYEMLTGRRPFEGRTDLESLELVRRCEFDPPGVLRPEVPGEVDQIIERALAVDPQARYQNIEDLYVDLQHAIYAVGQAVTSQGLAQALQTIFAEEAAPPVRKARNLDEALELELGLLGSDASDAALRTGTGTPAADLLPVPHQGGSPTSEPAAERDDVSKRGLTELSEQEAAEIAHAPTASRLLTPEPVASSATRAPFATPTTLPEPHVLSGEGPADALPQPAPRRRVGVWVGLALAALTALVAAFILPALSEAELTLESDPPGATIQLDGEELAGRRTPQTLKLAPGDYRVELSLDGHLSRNLRVELAPGEHIVLGARDLRLEPDAAPPRTFRVETSPEAARVSANGEDLGEAPVTLTLGEGEVAALSAAYEGCSTAYYTLSYGHQREIVSLNLSCLQNRALAELAARPGTQTKNVADDRNRPALINAALRKGVRVRLVPSPPQADLVLNGRALGPGPRQVQLPHGRTAIIEARAPGYTPLRLELNPASIQGDELALNLEESPRGCLNFRAIYPAHNEIAIDGAWLSGRHMTLRNHPLSAGPHTITVRNPEAGREERFEVTIAPGEDCAHLVVWDEER